MENHHGNPPNHNQNETKQAEVLVVMVPFPAQGHLNQLLHLSRIISSYNLPIHFVATATHSRQAKLRARGWDLTSSNISFHEFKTLHFPSPPPDPKAPSKFPSHLLPSFEASSHLREPFAKLLSELSPTAKKIIVIHDSLMGTVVQDVGSVPNAKAYMFMCSSAFTVFWYFWEAIGKPDLNIDREILQELPSYESSLTAESAAFIKSRDVTFMNFHSGFLYDTCKVIEGEYLALLGNEEMFGKFKHWAIGPFNPMEVRDNKDSRNHHKCLEWLDKQDENSVIYVSFGTTTSLSDEQILEIASGLEASGAKFIWVLRDADRGDIFQGEFRKVELPRGYEERLEGRGIVVRDWVPQLEILGHPSTGGFMSHCGWNSCTESISMGVPIAAWPMHSDQPRNASLITKVLKVGVNVRGWEKRDELGTSAMIEQAVRRLMGSKEGDEIRMRAVELGGAVRQSMAEGGDTRLELDSFIAHLTS